MIYNCGLVLKEQSWQLNRRGNVDFLLTEFSACSKLNNGEENVLLDVSGVINLSTQPIRLRTSFDLNETLPMLQRHWLLFRWPELILLFIWKLPSWKWNSIHRLKSAPAADRSPSGAADARELPARRRALRNDICKQARIHKTTKTYHKRCFSHMATIEFVLWLRL